jgi:Recombinase
VDARRCGEAAGKAVRAAKATAVRVARSQARAAELQPVIAEIRASGITSLGGIAKALNDKGIPTARGGNWQAVRVQRVLERLWELRRHRPDCEEWEPEVVPVTRVHERID